MDILELLPKTKPGNQFVVLMTNRYINLSKAIPTNGISATTVARIAFERRVANYGISIKPVNDSGSKFVSKFFEMVCGTLGVNNNTTIEHMPQTSFQAERFNSTLISRLHL